MEQENGKVLIEIRSRGSNLEPDRQDDQTNESDDKIHCRTSGGNQDIPPTTVSKTMGIDRHGTPGDAA